MNIFACDENPALAARALPDKLLVKMCLETAQILCTVINARGIETPYKSTHAKHPCVIWAGTNRLNFEWAADHGVALCQFYQQRFGRVHKCHAIIVAQRKWRIFIPAPSGFERTISFVQCMPDEFKRPNAVEAYRAYLQAKPYKLKWQVPEHKPEWWA